MKNPTLLFILAIFCTNQLAYSQSNIEKLRLQNVNISTQIKKLGDSLIIINELIKKEEKNQDILLLKTNGIVPIIVEVNSSDASLFSLDDPSSKVYTLIPIGTKLKIFDTGGMVGNYLKTEYNNNIGYVMDFDVKKTPELLKFESLLLEIRDKEKLKIKNEKIEIEDKINDIKRNKENASRKHELIKKYGLVIATKIMSGYIWIGMTDDMAIEVKGTPESVNRTVSAGLVSEQWVYPYNTYLYFKNGILDTWQN